MAHSQADARRRIAAIGRAISPAACAAPLFKKLLVVNRGEIAIRIMKGAKALGIKTVAIYAAADKDALHIEVRRFVTRDVGFELWGHLPPTTQNLEPGHASQPPLSSIRFPTRVPHATTGVIACL